MSLEWTSDSTVYTLTNTHPNTLLKLNEALHGPDLFQSFAFRVLLLTSVVYSTLIPEHVTVYCRKTFYCLFPGATQTLKHFTIKIC